MNDAAYDAALEATATALRCARIQAAASLVQSLAPTLTSGGLERRPDERLAYSTALALLHQEFFGALLNVQKEQKRANDISP